MAQLLKLANGDLFVGLEARGQDAVGYLIPAGGSPRWARVALADTRPEDGTLPQRNKPKKKTPKKKVAPKKVATKEEDA